MNSTPLSSNVDTQPLTPRNLQAAAQPKVSQKMSTSVQTYDEQQSESDDEYDASLEEEERQMMKISLNNDLRVIGRVIPDQKDGMLTLEDFQRAYMVIHKHAEKAKSIELEHYKKKRRRKLRELDLEGYREIVLQMTGIEDEIINDIQDKVCQKLSIDTEVFRESFVKVVSEQDNKEKFVNELKENALFDLHNSTPRRLGKNVGVITDAKQMSREFTFKVFLYEQDLRINAFKALERTKQDQVKSEFAVQNEILCDKLFAKFKVEKETYNQALIYHELPQDPQVKAIMAQVDAKVPTELREKIIETFTNPQEDEEDMGDSYYDDEDITGELTSTNMHKGVDLSGNDPLEDSNGYIPRSTNDEPFFQQMMQQQRGQSTPMQPQEFQSNAQQEDQP